MTRACFPNHGNTHTHTQSISRGLLDPIIKTLCIPLFTLASCLRVSSHTPLHSVYACVRQNEHGMLTPIEQALFWPHSCSSPKTSLYLRAILHSSEPELPSRWPESYIDWISKHLPPTSQCLLSVMCTGPPFTLGLCWQGKCSITGGARTVPGDHRAYKNNPQIIFVYWTTSIYKEPTSYKMGTCFKVCTSVQQ